MQEHDYRDSHTAAGFGASYHENYETLPGMVYMWKREQRVLKDILSRHFADRRAVHLDFACGTGRILGLLADLTCSSTGVDIAESMLEICRRNLPNVEIIQGDITRDPILAGRSFDLITAFRFFPNAQPALRTEAMACLLEHLTPDGLLVLNNHENESGSIYRIARLLGKKLRTMPARDVIQLVRESGLEIVEMFPLGVLPFSVYHLIVPGFFHEAFDAVANAAGLGKYFAQNIIYVCRRQPR